MSRFGKELQLCPGAQRSDALRELRQVLEHSPKSWSAHLSLARTYAALKNDPLAIRHARLAREYGPSDAAHQDAIDEILSKCRIGVLESLAATRSSSSTKSH